VDNFTPSLKDCPFCHDGPRLFSHVETFCPVTCFFPPHLYILPPYGGRCPLWYLIKRGQAAKTTAVVVQGLLIQIGPATQHAQERRVKTQDENITLHIFNPPPRHEKRRRKKIIGTKTTMQLMTVRAMGNLKPRESLYR
jgi:hypothetical protein